MRLTQFVLVLALVGFTFSIALADSTATPTQAQNLAALWPMIGLAIANVQAYGARKLTAEYTFFHTGWGAVVLALIGALITAATPVFQSGHVTWAALAWAAAGGASSFFATLNPSTTATDPPAKSPSARPGATMLLPLFLALLSAFMAVPGCAHLTPDQRAFGNAYATCMEGKGLTVAPGVAEEAWNDLNKGADQATIIKQLEALAGTAGTDAITCAVQAWLTGPTKGEKNPAGVAAANAYLKHGTTTRPNHHAAREEQTPPVQLARPGSRWRMVLRPPEGDGPSTGALSAS